MNVLNFLATLILVASLVFIVNSPGASTSANRNLARQTLNLSILIFLLLWLIQVFGVAGPFFVGGR